MTIPARLSIVTIGVSDLAASIAFYEALGWTRSSASNDGIAWFSLTGSAIGLFPLDELAADANVPVGGGGFGGITLAINLESEALVDAAIETAAAAGGTVTKPPVHTDWGGYSGYFADPDGYPWELAFNPFFPLGEDGALQLP
jgi:hypothetical protein